MSTYKRRIFLCCIGMVAGLAAWPAAEASLLLQVNFPSYLIFSIFLGSVFGIFIGAFFGSGDGIIVSNRYHIIKGVKRGLLIGAIGGMVGFIIAQGILFLIGEYFIHSTERFKTIGLPISRAIGWAFLGIFVGMVDGFRSGSATKIKVGVIGGLSGGFLGGLALEYLQFIIPSIMIARLIGLIIFGFFIGLLYGFVEAKLSFGVLTLLNGKFKGKDFLINQRSISIGSSMANDIVLDGYRHVDDKHALLKIKNDEVYIKPKGKENVMYANDEKIKDHLLKFEDVIRIGSAKMIYQYK